MTKKKKTLWRYIRLMSKANKLEFFLVKWKLPNETHLVGTKDNVRCVQSMLHFLP